MNALALRFKALRALRPGVWNWLNSQHVKAYEYRRYGWVRVWSEPERVIQEQRDLAERPGA